MLPRWLLAASLIALAAAPAAFAAVFLASAFTLVLLLDRASERLGYTPFWWMKLRIRLTLAVVFLLLLLAIAEFTH